MTITARFIAPVLAAGAVRPRSPRRRTLPQQRFATAPTAAARQFAESPGNAEIDTDQPPVQAPQMYGPFSSPAPFLFD